MTPTQPAMAPYPNDADAAEVAAHCFTLAEQIGGGPVSDALLAMARDYTARARRRACTELHAAVTRIKRDDAPRPAPRPSLLAELFEPLPALPRRPPAARPAGAAPAPRPVTAPAPRRTSRLFRMHALATVEC